jgi:hypothetical protein
MKGSEIYYFVFPTQTRFQECCGKERKGRRKNENSNELKEF